MAPDNEQGSGEQGTQDPVLALLQEIKGKLTGLEEDVAILGENDQKLALRLQNVEALSAGPTPALAAQQIEALQRQIQEVADRPEFVRTPDQVKAQYQKALKRAGEVEREQDVRCFWFPEPDPAKRDVPLTTIVRGPRAAEDARALGYVSSLDEAAQVLAGQTVMRVGADGKQSQVKRFASVNAARTALHGASAKFARDQVASAGPGVLAVPSASAAA